MADNGDKKPTEQDRKAVDIPDIKVTEEGAVGGSDDKEVTKKGFFDRMVDKLSPKSKSPEPSKDAEGAKGGPKSGRSSFSPKRILTDAWKGLVKGGSAEKKACLCESETTKQATPKKSRLAPPQEKDLGLPTSPSSQGSSGVQCVSQTSSSFSSAPSGYSSLPDDDTDITSPEDLDSPEGGKLEKTQKKSE